jgi:selenocysteine-specific elongation factor
LPGVERHEIARGDALVAPGAYPVSYRLDVSLDEIEPIRDGARVHVHLGTADVPARVVRLGVRLAQLRLSRQVAAMRGDRVILRGETTLAGGVVVDPAPPRHRDEGRAELVERGEIARTVHEPVRLDSLRYLLDGDPDGLERAGPWVFSRAWLDDLGQDLGARIDAADALDPGIAVPPDPWAQDVLPLLPFERRGAKLYRAGAAASPGARAEEAEARERELEAAGMRVTKMDDDELTRYLEANGRLVRLGEGYAIGQGGYAVAKDVLLRECAAAGEITLARFRDLLGIGRRDAQLLLERFDRDGLTRRDGERRVLRRAAQRA